MLKAAGVKQAVLDAIRVVETGASFHGVKPCFGMGAFVWLAKRAGAAE